MHIDPAAYPKFLVFSEQDASSSSSSLHPSVRAPLLPYMSQSADTVQQQPHEHPPECPLSASLSASSSSLRGMLDAAVALEPAPWERSQLYKLTDAACLQAAQATSLAAITHLNLHGNSIRSLEVSSLLPPAEVWNTA